MTLPLRTSVATLALLSAACSGTGAPGPHQAPTVAQVEDARTRAEAAVAGLGRELRRNLMEALAEGEPHEALEICGRVAGRVAHEIAEGQGFFVGRTALRLRNPDNAPDPFERDVMERWTEETADARAPVTAVYAIEGGHELRYMSPIVLQAPCLACHGDPDDLTPEVRTAIAESYPTDAATGFRSGDLRGAFTARVPIPAR